MSANWNILSALGTEIQRAGNFEEVSEIWHRFLIPLRDCKLIYSHPEESDTVMPSKAWPRDFRKGGFLRPLFAHDNLYFLDRRIAEEQWLGVQSPLNVDSTVEFDTNVASYVEMFVEGRENINAERVKEVLDFVVTTERVNFGYNFYALENARGYYDGTNAPSIRRNLRAIMKLDCLDEEVYRKTGEIRTVLTDRELDVLTDERLHALYDDTYKEWLAVEIAPVNEMLYVVLLKMLEIEHRCKGRELVRKVEDLYEFMHFELKTLLVREAVIALHYFKNRPQLAFFGKIRPRPKAKAPRLLKELRNMSWDLMLFRIMERMATLPGQEDFLIPYFLTFDRRMVHLFDLFPLKAILFSINTAQMIPLWETEPVEELRKEINTGNIEFYFGETARNVRLSERLAEPRPDFSGLRAKLEQKVVKLLSR